MEDLVLELLKDPRAQLAAILWLILEVRRLRGRVLALHNGHGDQEERIVELERRAGIVPRPTGARV